MTDKERLREKVMGPLTPEQIRERAEEGWKERRSTVTARMAQLLS